MELRAARRVFSRAGLSLFTVLIAATVLQQAAQLTTDKE